MASIGQSNLWLERIVQAKRAELADARSRVPQSVLEKKIQPRRAGRFRKALELGGEEQPECSIIAELKRASPSKGIFCQHYDPAAIARGYQQAGACALSVLTDKEFFLGSLEHLEQVKAAVSLPVLRKDFTLAEYHLYEAAAAEADAVLLIVAVLQPKELENLLHLGDSLGLDVLVEVHTAEELRIALDAGSEIVGINNRNLKTFEVSLETSLELIDRIPEKIVAVGESGLRTAEDLIRLQAAGFDAFLIGERFMMESDPGAALERLLVEWAARTAVSKHRQ
ncbi:MAG: indole-3-glycerol phosphate synthase TrpC [Acidobacteria bacterium]|nr:indole-3-glycerol phosphate synthase TrpC [Acidobacteriota bacterium]